MGGASSMNKGKRGEREINTILNPVVNRVYSDRGLEPPILQRNTMQSHMGGYDIVGLDWLAIEVKFQETLHLPQWWKQTIEQAADGQTPVLFYRQSRKKWRVRMRGDLPARRRRIKTVVDISIDDFIIYFEVMLQEVLDG